MPEGIFVLATVTVSGLFGLLVALTTSRITRDHEKLLLRHHSKKEYIESIKTLFVDAISVLDTSIRNDGMGDKDHQQKITSVSSKLELLTTEEIFKQFEETGKAIDIWATQYRKGQPKNIGEGMSIISSGDSAHQQKAVELFVFVENEKGKFVSILKNFIRTIENGT
jgi:hypothetical protein